MLLQQLKKPEHVTIQELEEMYVALATELNSFIDRVCNLNEAVTAPMSDDIEDQVDEISKRLLAAQAGLKIAKKLTNAVERKKHTLRILSNMKQIKRSLHKVNKQIAQFTKAEDEYNNDVFGDPGQQAPASMAAMGAEQEEQIDKDLNAAYSLENEEESMCGFCRKARCEC